MANKVHFNTCRNKSLSLNLSDPMRVCTYTSGNQNMYKSVYESDQISGEPFNISAVVVGQNLGTVTGSVYSNFVPLGKNKTANIQSPIPTSFYTTVAL